MDNDNLLNMLGGMDQAPLSIRNFLDQRQHVHQQQLPSPSSNLSFGCDFEPTPINEGSMSYQSQVPRFATSSSRSTMPHDPMEESFLLRHVLNQANNVMDSDHTAMRSIALPSTMQEQRRPSVYPVASVHTATRNEQVSAQEEIEPKTNAASESSTDQNANAQSGRWYERYQDLVKFKAEFGHCCVPSHWPRNPPLAQWVKRQRHQFKRSKEGLHSTITPARVEALNKMEFVWDPHSAFWEERLNELFSFRRNHGHCNVPTKFPDNPQLAIWAKCQRRQFKLYCTDGPKRSNMTLERIAKLSRAGFVFNPRQAQKRK